MENSPKLDGTPSVQVNLTKSVYNYRRSIILLVVTMGLLLTVAILVISRPREIPAGGLDGCVVSPDGVPLVAMVVVAKQSKSTFSDGCFFFADLPPGQHAVVIQPTLGGEWYGMVEIVSGKAVGLGEITISR